MHALSPPKLFRPALLETQPQQTVKLTPMSVRIDELLRLLIDIQCRCSYRFRRWNSTSHLDCCQVDTDVFTRLVNIDNERNDSAAYNEAWRPIDDTFIHPLSESESNAAFNTVVVNYADSLDSLQECDASAIFFDDNFRGQKPRLVHAHSSDSLDSTFNAMCLTSDSRRY